MSISDTDLFARVSQLLDRGEAELTRGSADNIDKARSNLQDVVQLFPQLISSTHLPQSALQSALAGLKVRVARCAILLETAGAFHRGLAIRTGQAGTSYTTGGLEVAFSDVRPPTAFHG